MKEDGAVAFFGHADQAGDHQHAHEGQQVVTQSADGLLEARQNLCVGRESGDDHGRRSKKLGRKEILLLAVRGVEAVRRVVEILRPLLRGGGRCSERGRVVGHGPG